VNTSLAELLAEARRAVRGECDFRAEDARKIREPVEEMVPIMAESAKLLRMQPELAHQRLPRFSSGGHTQGRAPA
jgi:hypothetical protein